MNAAKLGTRWQVPVVVSIEARTPAEALAAARALKTLLDDPMVIGLLRGNQIDARAIAVGNPVNGNPG